MEPHKRFKFSSIGDVRTELEKMKIFLPLAEDTAILQQPLRIGKNIIPNRMVVHPMEGCDGNPDGRPAELTRRRYIRFAEGGAGLLWFEATAIAAEGRANPRQLLITKDTVKDLKALLQEALDAAVNKHGSDRKPYTVLQLTHSGRYSRPISKPQPIIAANNPYLDEKIAAPKHIISDARLAELEDRYVGAAAMAAEIGFDAVDIKSCHRYLISELLAAHTREGTYGGPYGWGVDPQDDRQTDLSEPIRLVTLLGDKDVKFMNISGGNPYYNPHINRPWDFGPYVPKENQLYGVERMLINARDIQKAVPEMAILATGFSWLREFGAACAAGGIQEGWFQLAGFGRQSFAYPNFAEDIITTGTLQRKKCCIACGKCSELMRLDSVTGCVIHDAEVYRPIYKKLTQGKPSLVGKEVADHV
jgi:2,4-dienoyl-CoA reductase-like NADH-dependent reductase (Old Yellow Enzyme family)